MRKLTLAVVPLLVLACTKEPAGRALGPTPNFSATSTWTRWTNIGDFHVYVPCRGSEFHFYGEIPMMLHEVTSASGVYNYYFQILPVTPNVPYFGEELSSGIVFRYNNGLPINESYHLAAGEGYTLTDREVYVAPNGDRVSITFDRHFTVNANGDLVVDRTDATGWRCVFK